MPVKKLKQFLDDQQVKYVTIQHSLAYTAQETAQSAHIPGNEMAKTVMVLVDDQMAMAVLRAPDKVDLDRLRDVTGAKTVEFASEQQFQGLFPSVDVGAMPPFGNLYDMPVYVEENLSRDQQIAFNAGSHSELIQLAYDDFARLVEPRVASFSLT